MAHSLTARWRSLRGSLTGRGKALLLFGALPLVAILLGACGGNLDNAEQAFLAKNLGVELSKQGYTGSFVPSRQVRQLARETKMRPAEVASMLNGLSTNLQGTWACRALWATTVEPIKNLKGLTGKLTDLASDTLTNWLIEQGKEQLKDKVKGFLKDKTKEAMKEMAKQALADGMDFGYFATSSTFWFWNPETSEFITVTTKEKNGKSIVIVLSGVAKKKEDREVGDAYFEQFRLREVNMWADTPTGGTTGGTSARRCRQTQVVASMDPNDMLADPEGVGDQRFIVPGQVISYTIRFENMKTALAEAIDITITAQLDPGIDMDTVEVGPSSHPDVMTAEVDPSAGAITWLFKDINLLPNKNPPEGEGWVQFTASPRSDLPSGTPLGAKAAIRFDFNPPIETPEVLYTIDAGPPSTRVGSLEPVQLLSSFDIPWEGADDEGGSGIQEVAVLASQNGGPFEVAGTTSEPFQGEPGVTYGFVTVGVDQVGISEPLRGEPDVTVTVGQPLSFDPGLHLVGVAVVPERGPQDTLALPGPAWAAWDGEGQTYAPAPETGDAWPVAEAEVPGRGLWARFENEATAYITGQPVPADEPYAITLQPGWNLIASPYLEPVPWYLDSILVQAGGGERTLREAQAAGWVEDFAWGWDGEAYFLVYEASVVPGTASRLEPWQGYWVQAHRAVTLILPPS